MMRAMARSAARAAVRGGRPGGVRVGARAMGSFARRMRELAARVSPGRAPPAAVDEERRRDALHADEAEREQEKRDRRPETDEERAEREEWESARKDTMRWQSWGSVLLLGTLGLVALMAARDYYNYRGRGAASRALPKELKEKSEAVKKVLDKAKKARASGRTEVSDALLGEAETMLVALLAEAQEDFDAAKAGLVVQVRLMMAEAEDKIEDTEEALLARVSAQAEEVAARAPMHQVLRALETVQKHDRTLLTEETTHLLNRVAVEAALLTRGRMQLAHLAMMHDGVDAAERAHLDNMRFAVDMFGQESPEVAPPAVALARLYRRVGRLDDSEGILMRILGNLQGVERRTKDDSLPTLEEAAARGDLSADQKQRLYVRATVQAALGQVYDGLGDLAEERGDFAEAAQHFDRSVTLMGPLSGPHSAPIVSGLASAARCLGEAGDWQRAALYTERIAHVAAEAGGTVPGTHVRSQPAHDFDRQALPSLIRGLSLHGTALQRTGRPEAAVDAWHRALDLVGQLDLEERAEFEKRSGIVEEVRGKLEALGATK